MSRVHGARAELDFIRIMMGGNFDTVKECYEAHYAGVRRIAYSTLTSWWRHWEMYGEVPSETQQRTKVEGHRFRRLRGKKS